MLKRLAAVLLVSGAALMPLPACAQWSGEAVQSLPYLYHEQELKADITAMDAELQRLNLQALRDYYLAEVNKQPYVLQTFPEPLVYDDLSAQYVTLYQDIRNDFLRRIDADKDGLLSRLEREERQDYRNQLSSSDMVQLKDIYLKLPAFFDLPLNFVNYQRLAAPVEMQPKHDLAARQPLAQQLADLLQLQETNYAAPGDEVHAASPDIVAKNLVAGLTNNFNAEQLAAMLAVAQSAPGQAFLHMKDAAFKNRFISLQEIYRVELAVAVDTMRSRIVNQPPLVFSRPLFFRHHRHGH